MLQIEKLTLLLDESKWIYKICNELVEDEWNDNNKEIPHPACEICFDWYNVICIELDCKDLASKKKYIFVSGAFIKWTVYG